MWARILPAWFTINMYIFSTKDTLHYLSSSNLNDSPS
jgi:hypothetical protein